MKYFLLFSFLAISILNLSDFGFLSIRMKAETFLGKFLATESIKERRNTILGSKQNFITEKRKELIRLIEKKSHSWSTMSFFVATIFSAMGGFYLGGCILKNFLLGLSLFILFSLLPYFYLERVDKYYERDKEKKLLLVLGNLAASYLQTDNFLSAVEEVIDTIPEPLDEYFWEFIYQAKYISGKMEEALYVLISKIDNFYFQEFMKMIILAESGEQSLKYTVQSIPKDYQEYLERKEKYFQIISKYNRDFFYRIMFLPIVICYLKVLNENYYRLLVENFFGKTILFLVVSLYIGSIMFFRNANQDIRTDV